MLELKKVTKVYEVGEQQIMALNNVDITFRKNEFVSILGPSGCGKTTLLNIVGGLDKYSSGDLLINGVSTKMFKDSDWDSYRNTTIGFVFQNYNLISHLSLLDNVEMALALSGVSVKERVNRATKALDSVGLIDHINKKPNQLSGGQMQRVAIARALVNDPDVLLADEPTGALDSKTSVQIMDLIKEISKDRLVIMVTHNSKIAEVYSDRVINLLDGKVINDSNQVNHDEVLEVQAKKDMKKTKMSYIAALKSSFKNLFTKKGRTLITALAGSIGIIGISLILSLSNGTNAEINRTQEEAFSNFPITISRMTITDFFSNTANDDLTSYPDSDAVITESNDGGFATHYNNISTDFVEYLRGLNSSTYSEISYQYNFPLHIYNKNGNIYKEVLENGFSYTSGTKTDNLSSYDLLEGEYPESEDELVLVVDQYNQISRYTLSDLGLSVSGSYTLSDFVGLTYKIATNNVYFKQVDGVYTENTNLEEMYNNNESLDLEIVGVLRIKEGVENGNLNEGINALPSLQTKLHDNALASNIVIAQNADKTINVFTNEAFNDQLTFDEINNAIGGDESPVSINIYPKDVDTKKDIKDYLNAYNIGKAEADKVIYSDMSESFTGMITKIINTIALVLSALAGISLVVSSIMIGIITYVSVIERTKEIGIMRSLGARKKDISRIFNAETLIIGLTSGLLGVITCLILIIPANMIIEHFTKVNGLMKLNPLHALILIALSSGLTLLSGIIPSRIAAKKDPVIALRTE
ncbi:hypothetical protein CI105_06605 [Candidatus Izimaplasma bacterium ZiA1]|uniref:ABC transporter ATP-binding protein/permease n=1 Tax=Candidatus Izimoplasma sp. ZiA1 TaxID=2024899 RepID=UPI000BAA571E|nr:hypothetical protein CI105_06605 [Candidatus Izimaplasma bacterium ZiA1]